MCIYLIFDSTYKQDKVILKEYLQSMTARKMGNIQE